MVTMTTRDTKRNEPSVRAIISAARAVPIRTRSRGAWICAGLSALLLWASFPPIEWGPLGWIALVPLLLLIRPEQRPRGTVVVEPRLRLFRAAVDAAMAALWPRDDVHGLAGPVGLHLALLPHVRAFVAGGRAPLSRAVRVGRADDLGRPRILSRLLADRLLLVLPGSHAVPLYRIDSDQRSVRRVRRELCRGSVVGRAGGRASRCALVQAWTRPAAQLGRRGGGPRTWSAGLDGGRFRAESRRAHAHLRLRPAIAGRLHRRSAGGPDSGRLHLRGEARLQRSRGHFQQALRDDRSCGAATSPT